MSDLERVHIKLGLSGTYWDKRPQYRVSMNDQMICEDFITAERDVVQYVEFDTEYSTDTATLKIELLNKAPEDTKKDNYEDPDNYTIIDDMLLNIVSIEVDDINLSQIPFLQGEYRPFDRDEVLREFVNLGWNGAWTLTWTNPFYIWLLENM
jgi:hypothetical protein